VDCTACAARQAAGCSRLQHPCASGGGARSGGFAVPYSTRRRMRLRGDPESRTARGGRAAAAGEGFGGAHVRGDEEVRPASRRTGKRDSANFRFFGILIIFSIYYF
jgi:hypothetical protein